MKNQIENEERNCLNKSINKNEKEKKLKAWQKISLLCLFFLVFFMKEIILKAPEIKAAIDFLKMSGIWRLCFVIAFVVFSIMDYFFKGFLFCFIFIASVYALNWLCD